MPVAVTARQANESRQGNTFPEVIEKPFYRSLYFGSPPARGGKVQEDKKVLPQAYLIEQPEDSVVQAHFHDTNQYQVFVYGGEAFGKKPVNGLMVHYAKAHTPYGPIVAGPKGAHYMTLRNNWDSGAKIMPENRDKLRRIKRVHRVVEDIDIPDAEALRHLDVRTIELIPLQDDGLGTCQFDIGPGRECTVAMASPGAGAYALVIAGSVMFDGGEYEPNSLIYRGADEDPLEVTAGEDGASVLLLQFPPEPDGE